jgi:hypothetical protein
MTNKEFVLEVLRLIRPKYYNKITWLIVSAGLILMSPPLLTAILHIFIKKITEYNLIGENDIYWGLLLVLVGLVFNIISQILSEKSTINFNFVYNKKGNVSINQNTFIITDTDKAQEIIKTLSKLNHNITINYNQSSFIADFVELFKALPWIKGISLECIENNIEIFKIDYESSDKTIKQFYVNVYSSESQELSLSKAPKLSFKNTPFIVFIYWSKIGYWTLNSFDIFDKKVLSLDKAIKNDISNIVGDLTFIVSDLQIRMTYNQESNNKAISNPDYGTLNKVEIFQNGNYIDSNFLELGIIDSMIDMQVENVYQSGKQTVVIEKISYLHIFKLSTLILRFLAKSELPNEYKNTLTIRKSIVEFMKTISATIKYAIPERKSKQINKLFEDAFGDTWVNKQYKNRK